MKSKFNFGMLFLLILVFIVVDITTGWRDNLPSPETIPKIEQRQQVANEDQDKEVKRVVNPVSFRNQSPAGLPNPIPIGYKGTTKEIFYWCESGYTTTLQNYYKYLSSYGLANSCTPYN